MTVFTRRVMYIIAIVIFALFAPVLLFFSRGYRFDLRQFRIVRTGGLLIDSLPRGAQIHLDGKTVHGTTPTLLSLLPGSYGLSLAKEGYRSWTTTVGVLPTQTERIESTLFPASPRTALLPIQGVRVVEAGPRNEEVALLSSNDGASTVGIVSLQRLDYQPLISLTGSPAPDVDLRWSTNGRYLSLHGPGDLLVVFRASDGLEHPLPTPELTPSERLAWDRANDNIFFSLRESSLWKVDLFTKTAQVIASPGVADVFLSEDGLWILRKTASAPELQRIDPLGVNRILERRNLPQPASRILEFVAGKFVVSDGRRVIAVDRDGTILQSFPFEGTVRAEADRGGRVVLLLSKEEVWTLDPETLNTSLVVRSIDLQDATWHPQRKVVLNLTGGVLKAFENAAGRVVTTELGEFRDAVGLSVVSATTLAVLTRNDVSFLEVVR